MRAALGFGGEVRPVRAFRGWWWSVGNAGSVLFEIDRERGIHNSAVQLTDRDALLMRLRGHLGVDGLRHHDADRTYVAGLVVVVLDVRFVLGCALGSFGVLTTLEVGFAHRDHVVDVIEAVSRRRRWISRGVNGELGTGRIRVLEDGKRFCRRVINRLGNRVIRRRDRRLGRTVDADTVIPNMDIELGVKVLDFRN